MVIGLNGVQFGMQSQRVITKLGSANLFLQVTITDKIGRHEAPLL